MGVIEHIFWNGKWGLRCGPRMYLLVGSRARPHACAQWFKRRETDVESGIARTPVLLLTHMIGQL